MAVQMWATLTIEQGAVTLVAEENHILRVLFDATPDDAPALINRFHPTARHFASPAIKDGLQQIEEYFLGQRRVFDVQLDNASLSTFARRVHQALLLVPYGSAVSYGELAAMAGSPQAARAVGRVMSSNPFPLIIPCHRVINADGRLGQYSAAHGPETKAWLNAFERDLL